MSAKRKKERRKAIEENKMTPTQYARLDPKTQAITAPPAGSPSRYKPEYVRKVDEYIEKCEDEFYDYIKSENANGETREQKIRVSLPTRQGFANFIGVSFSNLTEWYAIPEMAIALQKIDAVQFTRLVNNGLSGSYNPSITKMLLSSNHGMSDNTKVEGEVGVVHKVMRLPTKSELDKPEN